MLCFPDQACLDENTGEKGTSLACSFFFFSFSFVTQTSKPLCRRSWMKSFKTAPSMSEEGFTRYVCIFGILIEYVINLCDQREYISVRARTSRTCDTDVVEMLAFSYVSSPNSCCISTSLPSSVGSHGWVALDWPAIGEVVTL